jgi:hypothetical protein
MTSVEDLPKAQSTYVGDGDGVRAWWATVQYDDTAGNHAIVALQAQTYQVHPSALFVKTEQTEDLFIAQLIDRSGQIYAHYEQILRASAYPESDYLLVNLTRMIEEAPCPLDAAKAILDAGWTPPDDDCPEDDYDY